MTIINPTTETMVANQKTKANACRNGAPDCGEIRVTPGNWAKSNVAPKLMPMVIPMVRANEFSDPATPETLASTVPIVKALFGERNNAMPAPLSTIGQMMGAIDNFAG